MDPGSSDDPLRRIAGVAGLLRALRTLHLLGHGPSHDRHLQHFDADDGQAIPVRGSATAIRPSCWYTASVAPRHLMPVARRLARRHRVLAWDARGHGHCQLLPDRPITLTRIAADLNQMLDHFGPIGTSVMTMPWSGSDARVTMKGGHDRQIRTVFGRRDGAQS